MAHSIRIRLLSCALVLTSALTLTPDARAELDPVPLLQQALRSRVTIHINRRTGFMVPAYHCRLAQGGCDARLQEFAQYLKEAGEHFELDPWLLAGMAVRESGMNPFAVGLVGERGILQLHPKNRHFKDVKFVNDGGYRARCQREVGACQREVVDRAAMLLARSLHKCGGDLTQALGMYNTGRCGGSQRYAQQVYRERRSLMRRVGLDLDSVPGIPSQAQASLTPKRGRHTKARNALAEDRAVE